MVILVANKVLSNKAFNIAKNPKYDGYQRELASVVLVHLVGVSKIRFFQKNNYLENYTNQLLDNFIKEIYIRIL